MRHLRFKHMNGEAIISVDNIVGAETNKYGDQERLLIIYKNVYGDGSTRLFLFNSEEDKTEVFNYILNALGI